MIWKGPHLIHITTMPYHSLRNHRWPFHCYTVITNGQVDFKKLQIVTTAHSASVTNLLSAIFGRFSLPCQKYHGPNLLNIPTQQFLPTFFFFQKSQCVPPSAPFTRLGGKQGLGLAASRLVVHMLGLAASANIVGPHLVSDDLTDIKTNALTNITALIIEISCWTKIWKRCH